MNTMRFGTISAREGAYLATLYAKHPQTELVAVADLDEEAFASGHEHYRLNDHRYRKYLDVDEMLHNERLDWVFIGTPDTTHAELGLKVLGAGCHAFIEKPMSQTIADADALCQAERETGKRIVVGCELRYTAGALRFRQLLRDGVIGQIIHGHCLLCQARGHTYFRRRQYRQMAYGSPPLLQKGIHAIDLLHSFVGSEPTRVFASGGLDFFGRNPEKVGLLCKDCDEADTCAYHAHHGVALTKPQRNAVPKNAPPPASPCVFDASIDVQDNSLLLLDYGNGARVSYSELYFTPDNRMEFDFFGTKGRAIYRYLPYGDSLIEIHGLYQAAPEIVPIPHVEGSHGGGDDAMRDAVVGAAMQGAAVSPTGIEGRAGVATILMALRSMETGQPMLIPGWEE